VATGIIAQNTSLPPMVLFGTVGGAANYKSWLNFAKQHKVKLVTFFSTLAQVPVVPPNLVSRYWAARLKTDLNVLSTI
jgi:hypothetical protein